MRSGSVFSLIQMSLDTYMLYTEYSKAYIYIYTRLNIPMIFGSGAIPLSSVHALRGRVYVLRYSLFYNVHLSCYVSRL